MDSLAKKTLTVSRSLTYTYYVSPAEAGRPTVLLLHGWPDSAALWSDVMVKYLRPAGYGILAPDCLGYGGTSKPTDPGDYKMESMAKDICEILDTEGLDKVVSLGHDWGSVFAMRFYHFQPERTVGLVMVNVAYTPLQREPTDLVQMEKMLASILGYFPFWYWYLFAAEDGAEILKDHVDSLWTAMHGPTDSWLKTFCTRDGMKNYLLEDRRQETQPYATEERRKLFIERMKRDGFEGPQCWYRAQVGNVNLESQKALPQDRDVVKVPTLFIGGAQDTVCLSKAIYGPQQAGLLPHLTIEEIDAGHWSMLAKPKEFGEILTKWLKENYV